MLIDFFIAQPHLFKAEYYHLISPNFLEFFRVNDISKCFKHFSCWFTKRDSYIKYFAKNLMLINRLVHLKAKKHIYQFNFFELDMFIHLIFFIAKLANQKISFFSYYYLFNNRYLLQNQNHCYFFHF